MIFYKNLKKIKQNLGGKANSLINLTNNKIPVPEFAVVESDMFAAFAKTNNIYDKTIELFSKGKTNEIKTLIMSNNFPNEMENEILKGFYDLKTKEVSVRSSASNEDGIEKSFAGQYETFLYVTENKLLDCIKKCWCSLFDDNVIAYTGKENMQLFSMNVVIQRMIKPEFAGVAFSVDPTSRSKNYSVAEAVSGDGEKLVSGSTTPTKFMLRRDGKSVDLKKGELEIDEKLLFELESYILKIEKIYGKPMDIEWCIENNVIYIVQARPITAINPTREPFFKVLTRDKALYELEINAIGEHHGIARLTNGKYYQIPLYIFDSKTKMTNILYNMFALEEFPPAIFAELKRNIKVLQKEYSKAKKVCETLKKVITLEEKFEMKKFIQNILFIQPFSSLGNTAGGNWKIDNSVKNILVEYREKYDKVIYSSLEFLESKVIETLPETLKPYHKFMRLDEIFNTSLANVEDLKKRKKGFIFYNEDLLNMKTEEFCEKFNFSILDDDNSKGDITGIVAHGGKYEGVAKIILSSDEFKNFKKGDILVTFMTTPKFTPIIKIAGGIITDEGGMTCHAAIVARELKIPCLVGTKNATKVIKNDSKIILDADNSKVILK